MEPTHSDWKSLPFEILNLIFEEVDGLCECALVCRTWLNPARLILYTNVTIGKLSQLKSLNDTVHLTPQLGKMVNTFDVQSNIGIGQKTVDVEAFNVFKNLLSGLPNLEELNGEVPYAPVLYSLLDLKLHHLKKLESPSGIMEESSVVANYITCAFLLRDRLENIFIQLNQPMDYESQHLFDSLHQFDKLTEIEINGTPKNTIQALEHIAESCTSLKKIAFTFYGPENLPAINYERSEYVPRTHIKSLDGCSVEYDPNKFLLYVIHTFSQLDNLSLGFDESMTLPVDHQVIKKLLDYVSEIDSVSIMDILADQRHIMNAFIYYWETKKNLRDEKVEIVLSNRFNAGVNAIKLDVYKEERQTMEITFAFSKQNFDWHLYMDFIKDGGRFICNLQFASSLLSAHHTQICELPQNFFPRTFAYCQHLEYLHLDRCVLKEFTYLEFELSGRVTLNELYLKRCLIYPNILEQLSKLVSKIKILSLERNKFSKNGIEADDQLADINMPHTEIDTIRFDRSCEYLHIKDTVNEQHYFYQVTSTKPMQLHSLDENEYSALKYSDYSHIYCQNKPVILEFDQ